jgi:AcrR family transcriptional regulator
LTHLSVLIWTIAAPVARAAQELRLWASGLDADGETCFTLRELPYGAPSTRTIALDPGRIGVVPLFWGRCCEGAEMATKDSPAQLRDGESAEDRTRRIVETALALAEEGGFEAVRLRDVAAHAGVALGTLYRRFRSKEDLLVAALEYETRALAVRVEEKPLEGRDPLTRVMGFFTMATNGMIHRPNLARALVKAAASGDPELAKRVAGFHERVERMIVSTLRGPGFSSEPNGRSGASEVALAYNLNLFWFALMVGWSGGLHSRDDVITRMRTVAAMLLRASKD